MNKVLILSILLLNGVAFHSFGQANISGIVNVYTAVNAYDTCNNNCFDVASSTGFAIGDYVLIIQMKGMTINETNTSSFGSFISYDSTGFYEKNVISSIVGNRICFNHDLTMRYKLAGKVQLVKIARYPLGANVVGTLQAQAWNGSTGGIIAVEVLGTLTLNANIDASGTGLKGGKSGGAISNLCNGFTSITDYATDSLSWEYKSFKGEGVANYVANKWSCRGPQANGGGGGNDHNSGGGGGANLTSGGLGGRNNEPGTFNCKGYQPGLGGIGLQGFPKDRLFLGGGGGSGHQNNAVNFQGGNGGGIIYIRASTLVGNNRLIIANGDSSRMSGQDGGSGGGAGGTIKLDIASYTGTMTIAANGGRGSSTNNAGLNRCFGPGGGGSGGAILFNSSSIPVGVSVQTLAGAPGVVFNSSNACSGTSNSATAGSTGIAAFNSNPIVLSRLGASNCLFRRSNYVFSAEQKEANVYALYLSATQFQNGTQIVFERSADGLNYTKLEEQLVRNEKLGLYQTVDASPLLGKNYYRAQILRGSQSVYESEAYFFYNGLNWTLDDIVIYPNPVEKQQALNIVFPSSEEQLAIKVYDIHGRILDSYYLSSEQAINGQMQIAFPKTESTPFLFVQLSSASGAVFTKKVFLYNR